MKVLITKKCETFKKNQEVEFTNDKARELIKKGFAKQVETATREVSNAETRIRTKKNKV